MKYIYWYTMEKNEYNDIPVHYCKSCLSLRVLNDTGLEGLDYCDSCGSTDIDISHIDEWTALYRNRYDHDYINNGFNSLLK